MYCSLEVFCFVFFRHLPGSGAFVVILFQDFANVFLFVCPFVRLGARACIKRMRTSREARQVKIVYMVKEQCNSAMYFLQQEKTAANHTIVLRAVPTVLFTPILGRDFWSELTVMTFFSFDNIPNMSKSRTRRFFIYSKTLS